MRSREPRKNYDWVSLEIQSTTVSNDHRTIEYGFLYVYIFTNNLTETLFYQSIQRFRACKEFFGCLQNQSTGDDKAQSQPTDKRTFVDLQYVKVVREKQRDQEIDGGECPQVTDRG